ncbi:MAG: T9SS type A sorting domain-containing protein, partial [Flavobacteriales bacterium]
TQNGNVLFQGGTYDNNAEGDVLEVNFCLTPGCYTLTMYDEFGDGMCCEYGNGSFTLLNQNQVSYATGGTFADSDAVDFCVDANAVSELDGTTYGMFPNPAATQLTITNTRNADYIEIRDISGRLLKKANCNDSFMQFPIVDLADGTYFVSVFAQNKQSVTRITVQH